MNKNLICYFSATGKTKDAALKIKTILNGDLFEIIPTIPYANEDLDWTNMNSRTSIEMQDDLSRPSIKSKIENLDNYQNIYIGFPIWWYKAPTIINTFIEENNLTNKDIYIFVTSGSSGVLESFNNLKTTYPNLHFKNAIRITDETNIKEIKEFGIN